MTDGFDLQKMFEDLQGMSAAQGPMPIAPTFPDTVSPVAPMTVRGSVPTKAPSSGFDWKKLLEMAVPLVGGLAAHGQAGQTGFQQGWLRGQAIAQQEKERKAQIAQRQRQLGSNYVLEGMKQLGGIDDPAQYAQMRDAFMHNAPDGTDLNAFQGATFPKNKLAAQQLKRFTDEFAKLKDQNIEALIASGSSVSIDGTLVPVADLAQIAGPDVRDREGRRKPLAKKLTEQPSLQEKKVRVGTEDVLASYNPKDGKYYGQDGQVLLGAKPVPKDVNPLDNVLKQLRVDAAQRPAAGGGTSGSAGTGAGELTTEGIDYAATQYRVTGVMPPMGMGKTPMRAAIINKAAEQARVLGQSAAGAIQKQAAYKSDASALTQMRKMSSSAEAFETKALAQAEIVDSLSQKVGRTQYPILNEALLAGKARITGDADTQLLFNALTTFTTEYAKIMEGSTGSASGSTESARAAAKQLVSASLNKNTLAQTIDLMRREMRLTVRGYDATIAHINERMGGDGGGSGARVFYDANGNPVKP